MPRQPDGQTPPPSGALPAASRAAWGQRAFGVYVHVPFCATRCGYCDFNTYTAPELGVGGAVDRDSFDRHLAAEVSFARRVLGPANVAVDTVFFGGGTPTLLSPGALARVLSRIRAEFGLAVDAEVTVEANPDSVDRSALEQLRCAGVTRISFGMQSAVPHVLGVLERTHTPDGALRAVADARAAGFERISVDLIYGTPGESLADWQQTVATALSTGVGHVSAYSLIVEPGTRLAAAVRRGVLPSPDPDLAADMYELADGMLAAAGLPWYELSNWAAPGQECRHNNGYWHSDDWWGIGPGAHSHVAGTRWWNVAHPAAYVRRSLAGESPAAGREVLDPATRSVEELMLGIRMSPGVPVAGLSARQQSELPGLQEQGLTEVVGGRLRLTRRGRLLADAVVRLLVP